ncbi:MAG TPA: XRE family transcriptional regulator [Polyangiaceae bacterium]|jgi:transcriptional regulator with XRE-family HTH domain|nr:XRE family transcriptional regulator [Polyangiaceae bacterium]
MAKAATTPSRKSNAQTKGRKPRRSSESASVVEDLEVEDLPASDDDAKPGRVRGGAHPGDDLGAAELTRRVAESLRRYRSERKLSLDDLAVRSGVSRAALSQIEGRRTNPTLSVLWKIAVGLEIPFQDLLGSQNDASIRVLRAGDALPMRSADGRTESRLLSPGGSGTGTEVYEMRLLPKAVHKSEAHAHSTTETLIVLTGNLRLSVGGTSQEIAAGDTVFFRADVPHSYENTGTREARCIDVIHYAR